MMCGEEFEDWIEELTDAPQPICNLDDIENCDSCGS